MIQSPGDEVLIVTHKIGSSFTRHFDAIEWRNLPRSTKVDQFDVEASPGYHDDVVGLKVQVYNTDMVQKLESIQYLWVKR